MADEPAAPAPAAPPADVAPPPAELLTAQARFERGDFRSARAEIARILGGSPSPELAAAARTLDGHMATDPWAVRFGLGAAAILALVIWLYVL